MKRKCELTIFRRLTGEYFQDKTAWSTVPAPSAWGPPEPLHPAAGLGQSIFQVGRLGGSWVEYQSHVSPPLQLSLRVRCVEEDGALYFTFSYPHTSSLTLLIIIICIAVKMTSTWSSELPKKRWWSAVKSDSNYKKFHNYNRSVRHGNMQKILDPR